MTSRWCVGGAGHASPGSDIAPVWLRTSCSRGWIRSLDAVASARRQWARGDPRGRARPGRGAGRRAGGAARTGGAPRSCVAEGGTGCRAGAEARPADPDRGDRLVLLPGPGRPRRRRPAGDRRAVLLDVRLRRGRHTAGPGPGEQGPGLRAVGGHRPRGRRRHRHRGRRQRGHRGGVRVPRGPAAAQGRVAGVHEQRWPVPGGPRARRRRPGRRRPGRGRGDDDQHVSQGRPGLRVRRERAAVPASRTSPRLAPQPGLRRLRRERRHRQHRRRPGAGDPRHLRQPPDQRLQPRRHLDPRLALVHQPRVGRRGEADGLGRLHPVGQPQGRAAPLPPAQGSVAEPGPPAVAAVDRLAALGGRPGRRRPQRGDRAAQRREAHPLPHAGLRVHGAGRGVRRRKPLGHASPGLREAPDVQPSGPPSQRRLVPTHRHPRPDRRRPHRRRPTRDRRGAPRRQGLRGGAGRPAGCGPPSTPRSARRRSPPRWSRPT